MYRVGDLVLVNRWPTSQIVKDYCYAAEILEIKEEPSLFWTSHSLDQVYYKIKPWIDEGLVFDISEQLEKDSLLGAMKKLSAQNLWMGHDNLSPLRYNEEEGVYEMAYNDDESDS